MDAGKIMRAFCEHPQVDFGDMAMRFAEINKSALSPIYLLRIFLTLY